MRIRLRKADRIRMAGKGCNKAQYAFGATKRKDKVFRTHPKISVPALLAWVAENTKERRIA